MATPVQALVNDGFQELSRGVHSGKSSRLLTRSHVAWAENATFRGDLPQPRPGWQRLNVDLTGITGRFQGATVHEPLVGDSHIVMCAGGRIYMIDVLPVSKEYHEITIPNDAGSPNPPRVWFASTPGYTIIQDGLSRAVIYNGATCRRANPAQREVPFGTVMAYGSGRLWVATADRRSFVASDLINGPSGTPANSYRDAVLKFTENEIVRGGGAFGVPFEAGEITAMKFVRVQDASTGDGPLLIGTRGSTFSVNVPFDRTQWKELTSPAQSILLPNGGPVGAWSLASVNGDIWYRDQIGIRSAQSAYRDFGTWTNTPLSRPVSRILQYDDANLLEYASAVEFGNRLLMTVSPQRSHESGTLHRCVYHLGIVGLDFDQISDTEGVGSEARPVWEGLWTGLKILQLITGSFNGVKRCFALTYSEDNAAYAVWELTNSALWDDEDQPIRMVLETPEYNFQLPGGRKELHSGRYWLRDMSGQVSLTTKFAPDGYPVWQPWSSTTLCATVANCGTDSCYPVPRLPQPRNPIVLPDPPPTCVTGRQDPTNIGYNFALRIELTGRATIAQMRVDALPKPEDRPTPCGAAETCVALESCGSDPYEYVIEN